MASNDLPIELYQTLQIRTLEKIAIQSYGLSESDLMAKAGSAAFHLLQEKWPDCEQIIVFCGPGNNGGDGYVLAKLAANAGLDVQIYYVGDVSHLQGAAKEARSDCLLAAIPCLPFVEIIDAEQSSDLVADVIVDAIFGTGLTREVVDEYQIAIDFINKQAAFVLAMDVPSGLNSDTGHVLGAAVIADVTCTFIGLKQGLLTGQAPDYVGELYWDELSLPRKAYQEVQCSGYRITQDYVDDILVARHPTAHKGEFGHVLIIGGNFGMPGSVRMTGEAALRVGAGLVTVATRSAHIMAVVSQRPEIMCMGIEKSDDLVPLLSRATAVVIGPGLGQDEWAQALFDFVLQNTQKPLLIDADGLNLLAKCNKKNKRWILTPHPGEAARLLNTSTQKINEDRFRSIFSLQERYDGVILLKGAGTLIKGSSDKEPSISLVNAGNPGMASAGMGDVLSGVIGGLLASGLPPDIATEIGAWVHATAGDYAAAIGERGLIASDLMPFIRQLVNG